MSKHFLNSHREVCPTCEGKACIVCCSIDDNTDCEKIVCPMCNGKGHLVNTKNLVMKIVGVGVLVAIIIVGIVAILR